MSSISEVMFGQLRAAKGHTECKADGWGGGEGEFNNYASFKFPISGYCLPILFYSFPFATELFTEKAALV